MTRQGWEPQRWRLDNGLTVMHQENAASAAVTVTLSVAAGAVFDAGRAGLATLVGRGLTRGTADRSKRQIGEVLDFRGAQLAGSAGRHDAAMVARCRSGDLEPMIDLMADCATGSVFPPAEVDKLIGDRLTGLREEQDDPGSMVMHLFRELVYPADHPYHARLYGTEDSVKALRLEDLQQLYGDRYRADRALLVLVGGIAQSTARQLVERYFATWVGGDESYREAQAAVADAEIAGPSRRQLVIPDKQQAEVAVGHVGIRRSDPSYYAAALMNMVLGRFAMGGRLGRSVREEQGLAYTTYSSLAAGLGPGPVLIRAGVQPRFVDAAVASIVREVERIRDEPVPESELDDARAAAIRSLPRTLESNEGVAGLLQQIELYDLGLDHVERYGDILGRVQAPDLLEAARQILHPEALAVAVAGPAAAEEGAVSD